MDRTAEYSGTVLLVDDEETDRTSIRESLQSEGFQIIEAGAYREAAQAFAANQSSIALLIADISLPDGNGCELAVTLRNDKPDLRVLFVSGHVGAEVCRFYGLEITDVHFLRKPFTGKQLISRVRRVMKSPHTFPRRFSSGTVQSSGTGE